MPSINTIATFQRSFELRQRVADQSAALNKAGQELATGLKQDVFDGARGSAGESIELRSLMGANEALLISNKSLSGRMENMSTAVSSINDNAREVLNFLISGAIAETNRDTLQTQARDALTVITNRLNSTYAGSYVFSGQATDTESVTLNPDWSTTYTGDTTGNLRSRIDEDTTMTYGIRADHGSITDILAALGDLANTNMNAMTDAGFAAFRTGVIDQLSSGVTALTEQQAQLGDKQAYLDETMQRLEGQNILYQEAILGIEGVDATEASVRLTGIKNQLEATFAVTARISEMSILRYL